MLLVQANDQQRGYAVSEGMILETSAGAGFIGGANPATLGFCIVHPAGFG